MHGVISLASLLIALIISLISHEFGDHPDVGTCVTGLIIKQDYFFLL